MKIACDICQAEINRSPSKIKQSKNHYCSHECQGEALKLSKEELQERKNKRHKKWREDNKEQQLEYWRNYRKDNKEHLNSSARDHHEKNKDARNERRRELYQDDIEEKRKSSVQRHQKWREKNPDRALLAILKCQSRTRITQKVYREKQRAIKNSCKIGDEKLLREFYEKATQILCTSCCYCERDCGLEISGYNRDATIDHKTPISCGGDHDVENLVICCRECNSRKANKTEEMYIQYIANVRRVAAESGIISPV